MIIVCRRSTVRLDIGTYGPRREKTCLRRFANNKGADQPAQSDQRLCYSLFGKHHIYACYERNFDFLVSLCS